VGKVIKLFGNFQSEFRELYRLLGALHGWVERNLFLSLPVRLFIGSMRSWKSQSHERSSRAAAFD